MKDLVSIIIVNFNGKSHLQKCLPSLKRQEYKKIEIILVDNASQDGSIEWVRKNFPDIKIILNQKNLGFAEGNNIGYKKCNGKYVLFLNNDTETTPNFLASLMVAMKKNPQVGGMQSKIKFMDDPKRLDSTGSFLTNTGFLFHEGIFALDSKRYSCQKRIYSAKGACMLFRKEVLEQSKVDGEIFDGRYFAYFEETDLCHRVWLLGYEILFVPTSIIYHKFGATSQKLAKPFVEYHSYKNRINSYVKNLELENLALRLSVHLIICEIVSLVFLLRGRLDICLAIQKAIWWNVAHLDETLKKRRYIQTYIRRVTDSRFLSMIVHNPPMRYYLSQLLGWNTTRIDSQ